MQQEMGNEEDDSNEEVKKTMATTQEVAGADDWQDAIEARQPPLGAPD